MWARRYTRHTLRASLASFAACLLMLTAMSPQASAITAIPTPPPQPGSYGLEATKTQPPPTQGATITVPGGGSFSTSPITVSGICPGSLLVEVYDNGVLVGSTMCSSGSFSVQITLFNGQNDLTAGVFDDLDQAGPASNSVIVTYNNTSFTAFGALITLTSNYGRRSADPGSTLTWPLLLSGGTGLYAFSIDWGDGGSPELKSQSIAGTVNISHVYNKAGIYHVTVRVTDANGVSAFLQLIAVANGNATTAKTPANKTTVVVKSVLWLPTGMAFVLLLPAYWLGRRSELVTLRNKLAKDAANYKEL